MRQVLAAAAAVAVVVSLPGVSFAQEWTEYVDRTERFSSNFPGAPTIKDLIYQPQRGKPVPARVVTALAGAQRYSVTVVNLATLNQPSDVKGSVAWEAWNFRKRGGEITCDAFAQVDRIDGHQMHITNPDKTVTLVGIYVHARRLYILEATVPAGAPGAVHFQQSLIVLDEAGQRVRYEQDSDGIRTTRITDRTDIC